MRADVADCSGDAAASRVGAPACLLVFLLFQRRGQPALGVFHENLAQCAQPAIADQLACLADHRVAAVVVGHSEHDPVLLNQLLQLRSLFRGQHQRLVADDVETGLHEGARDREVHVVGRHDGYGVDALTFGSRSLLLKHFLPAAVISVIS